MKKRSFDLRLIQQKILIISIVLVLVLAVGTAQATQYKRAEGDSGPWIITVYTGGEEIVTLPQEHLDEKIVGLGTNAFLPAVLNVKEVTVPNGYLFIRQGAFKTCTVLTKAELADSITEIGPEVFAGCSVLTDVKLPSGLTLLPDRLFDSCRNLEAIKIPQTVTTIGEGVFVNCQALKEVVLPESALAIGTAVFKGCKKLANATLPGKLKAVPDYMFEGCSSLESITLPAGTEQIGAGAFKNSGLKSITLPESVISLGAEAFYGTAQEYISLPDHIVTIGKNALANKNGVVAQKNLGYLHAKLGSTTAKTLGAEGYSFLDERSGLILQYLFTDGNENGLKVVSATAGLKDVVIPDGVTEIGANAFAKCAATLETVTIPASVKVIDNNALKGCSKLTDGVITSDCGVYAYTWAKEKSIARKAKQHLKLVEDPEVAPGYDHTGLTAGTHCEHCGTVVEKQEVIPALDLLPGDVNDDGVVDGLDVLRLMKFLAGEMDPQTGELVSICDDNADVDGSGSIDEKDLLRLVRYLGGEDVTLEYGNMSGNG